MKKVLLLIAIVYTSVYAYTITHDNGRDFDGYCGSSSPHGNFYGFYDSSNSYGQACAGGECVSGNYSKSTLISKACKE